MIIYNKDIREIEDNKEEIRYFVKTCMCGRLVDRNPYSFTKCYNCGLEFNSGLSFYLTWEEIKEWGVKIKNGEKINIGF